jgi:hypothetical protein
MKRLVWQLAAWLVVAAVLARFMWWIAAVVVFAALAGDERGTYGRIHAIKAVERFTARYPPPAAATLRTTCMT